MTDAYGLTFAGVSAVSALAFFVVAVRVGRTGRPIVIPGWQYAVSLAALTYLPLIAVLCEQIVRRGFEASHVLFLAIPVLVTVVCLRTFRGFFVIGATRAGSIGAVRAALDGTATPYEERPRALILPSFDPPLVLGTRYSLGFLEVRPNGWSGQHAAGTLATQVRDYLRTHPAEPSTACMLVSGVFCLAIAALVWIIA